MINCIVVDDEPLAIELLKDFIEKMPELSLKETFINSLEALSYVNKQPIDLIFLDIQMPDLNGIDFLKNLKSKPDIILTTAFQEFAIEGYNFDVLDFLLKPIEFPRFLNAVKRAEEHHELKKSGGNIVTHENHHRFLFVKTEYKLIKVNYDDILYIEGLKDYSKIYTRLNAKPIVTLQNLKSFEEKFKTDEFIRVHRSYIISLAKIDMIARSSIMVGNKEIPVSDAFKGQLKNIVKRYS
ncbi:LytR/AlgR family response regulator transcription factor [Arachidicoccus sp.]|uniref:LytR/AlgR family response regulator transcription factor n=1 Tax=Arachidicoccus sp. TaxID=1872624 RepID=UPI003D24A5E5